MCELGVVGMWMEGVGLGVVSPLSRMEGGGGNTSARDCEREG